MVQETALYEQLGISHDASVDDIRRSYRQAALRWHPDRNQDNPAAADNFKACLQAYEILSDPSKRANYDAYGMNGVAAGTPATYGSAPQQQQDWGRSWHGEFRRDWHRGFRDSQDAQDSQDPETNQGFQNFHNNFHRDWQEFRSRRPRSPLASRRWSSAPDTDENGARDDNDQHQQDQGRPRAFQASWSFQMSSSTASNADGTYSTQYHTWDSRDGHRSGSSSGTLGEQDFNGLPQTFIRQTPSFFSSESSGLRSSSLFAGSNMSMGFGSGIGIGGRRRTMQQQPSLNFWWF